MDDPGQILEMIQRQDDEAMMWSLTCLEQMNEKLAMSSDAREMLHCFPPQAFIPALCTILSREVNSPSPHQLWVHAAFIVNGSVACGLNRHFTVCYWLHGVICSSSYQ